MPAVLRIALPVPLPTLFDYLPPAAGEAGVGSRVLVPFGRGKRVGVVVAIEAAAAVEGGRLKQVVRLLDDEPLLDAELMQTLAWAADYWLGAPGEAYGNALPLALREAKPLPPIGDEYWSLAAAGHQAHEAGNRRGGSKALLALLATGALSAQELTERLPGWREAARRLAAAGLLERSERPPADHRPPPSPAPQLNEEQQQAVATVGASLGSFQPFLLDGVTGSGKTEVYLALIEQVDGFRYHARDLAVVRARALGVPVLLGSGTPSLESLANAEAGRYRTLHLRARPGAIRPPQVQIIDMRAQRLEHGMSPALLAAVAETVARGEQALVFRNRRGYAPVLLCHACGWHADCPRCERPLTLHAGRRQLICHHCDYRQRPPQACPTCGAGDLKPQGQGTERLEEALVTLFPQVPVLRVDRETTRRRDAFEQLLETLADDQPAILVGTQMLAKGHDLPNLTLVAIVGVDEGLHSIDFRAGERLAQLVVQVAGRAGRARKPGRVVLQTHQPAHPLLRSLLAQGYAAAARELLAERRLIQLPPYSHQVLLRAESVRREDVDAFLASARAALPQDDSLQIAGPMPAPMPLRAGRHRAQLLLEAQSRRSLHGMLRSWQTALAALPLARKLRWSLDVDPIDLY